MLLTFFHSLRKFTLNNPNTQYLWHTKFTRIAEQSLTADALSLSAVDCSFSLRTKSHSLRQINLH